MAQRVLFRLDDVCEEMDYEKFLRLKEIFDRYGVKPIIGVVPHNEDKTLCLGEKIQDFWDLVRQLQKGGWTIAQHGYRHIYETCRGGLIPVNKKSEFAGLSFAEQLVKIQKGKEILLSHGIKTDIFMAPAHSFDKNTLRALKQCHFKYITDGRANHPYKYMDLIFVPCKDAKIKNRNRFTCVCYHTNTMPEKRYIETEAFLSRKKNCVISFMQAALFEPHPYFFSRIFELFSIMLYKTTVYMFPIYQRLAKFKKNIIG